MEELTYAQEVILQKVQEKQEFQSFQDYLDYYCDFHGDYYDADYN